MYSQALQEYLHQLETLGATRQRTGIETPPRTMMRRYTSTKEQEEEEEYNFDEEPEQNVWITQTVKWAKERDQRMNAREKTKKRLTTIVLMITTPPPSEGKVLSIFESEDEDDEEEEDKITKDETKDDTKTANENTADGEFPLIPARISKYITGMDRRTVRAQTVLDCFKAFNTRYAVKYKFFARILTPRGAQTPLIY
jgi:hypothetical protein